MTLKSILVYVSDSDQARTRIAWAVELAKMNDAHLTGLAVRSKWTLPGYVVAGIPHDIRAEILQNQKKENLAARQIFEKEAARTGWSERTSWIDADGLPSEVLGLHARYHDLTIVGQQSADDEGIEPSFVDTLILKCGRPVLVVPKIGANKAPGKHIVVAWNGSREAARAVGDAMPILEMSRAVDVLSIEPEGIGDLPGADIANHLARHGIKATAKRSTARKIDFGDVLLNYVSDSGADLVVMGAYGHSRLRELVLGGVTRHMLEHMTVPVLLSH